MISINAVEDRSQSLHTDIPGVLVTGEDVRQAGVESASQLAQRIRKAAASGFNYQFRLMAVRKGLTREFAECFSEFVTASKQSSLRSSTQWVNPFDQFYVFDYDNAGLNGLVEVDFPHSIIDDALTVVAIGNSGFYSDDQLLSAFHQVTAEALVTVVWCAHVYKVPDLHLNYALHHLDELSV